MICITVRIKWFGNATFEIISDKGRNILLDPWIIGNPYCPIKLEDINEVDLTCVTHGHPGHYGNSAEIAIKTGAFYISSREVCTYAKKRGQVPERQLIPMEIGEVKEVKGIRIIRVEAHHPPIQVEVDIPCGPNAGYVVITEEGTVIFHTGDTLPIPKHAEIREAFHPIVVMMSLDGILYRGDSKTAIANAIQITKLVSPNVVLPFYRFDPSLIMPRILSEEFKKFGLKAKVVIMQPGDVYEIEATPSH